MFSPFDDSTREPAIHGFWHEPTRHTGNAIVLAHGAGANCQSKLLVEMANALADAGFGVLRFDLPFRVARLQGPPHPGTAVRDRDGLRRAAALLREKNYSHVFMGGHSYGGRQATMLAAEEPRVADGLLLLSYPLHPPRKPEELRTSHFPKLTTPAFFIHGTRDPFATPAEMQSALALVPGPHAIMEVDGAGHDLLAKKAAGELPAEVAHKFKLFLELRE